MPSVLERIEIQGFKSFYGKTELVFPANITCVIGPNGSGKSNIVDAVRWVLGERAAKNLRGESLENLIFSGTPKKPAASFARVALYFKKADLFEEAGGEAVIERRADRSGSSQIFVNSAEIKLKDLTAILARAKLGVRGLTVIGQSQGDIFVRSAPKERRLMIEEILGLKEFRLKKEEAEKELEASRINTEKVRAMLLELEPRLKFLEKQKHRWDKREELENELKTLENFYFGTQITELNRKGNELKKPLQELALQKQKKEFEIFSLETEAKSLKPEESFKELEVLRQKINRIFAERLAAEKELMRCELELDFRPRQNTGEKENLLKETAAVLRKINFHIKDLLKKKTLTLEEAKAALQLWLTETEIVLKEKPEKKESSSRPTEEIVRLKNRIQELNNQIENLKKRGNSNGFNRKRKPFFFPEKN